MHSCLQFIFTSVCVFNNSLTIFLYTCSKDSDILPQAISLFTKLLPPNNEAIPTDTTVLLKVALQLLGNACAGYPEGQERVWQLCFPQHFRYKSCTVKRR